MTVIIRISYLECVYQSADLRVSLKTETLPKNIHDGATTFKHGHAQTRKRHAQTCTDTRIQKRNDMHRHAQQPFFPCNRPLASLRLKLRKTKKPSNLSCQIHVTTCETSEKQCATKHDKQNINNDSAHADMVNDNMHIHTCVQPTAGLFSSSRAFKLLWDKGSTPWRSRPLGAKDDVRFLTSSFQKTMSETSPFQKTMS